ncbi:MAG: PQQ-binding-like beta-propeller repeat protein, partial [bacterium]
MKTWKPDIKTVRLLQNVALVSGIFAFILSVLIIVNFAQTRRADPLNISALKVLHERLNADPENDQLRTEIRELDLLARKAYFTNQWQVRTGGLILFISVVVVIISLKTIELLKQNLPEMPESKMEVFWADRKLNRRWVAITGIVLVLLAFALAIFTRDPLGDSLKAVGKPTEGEGLGGNPKSEIRNLKSEIGNRNRSEAELGGAKSEDQVTRADSEGSGAKADTATENKIDDIGYPTQKEIIANFPAFRGPGGLGISYQKNIPVTWDGNRGKNILWKTAIPLQGFNSPILWEGRIYLSGANDVKREVYCIDAESGKMIWKRVVEKFPGTPSQAPKVNKETGQSAPTLTTDGRRVYAIFANGDLAALDMEGNLVWGKNIGVPVNHYGHSSSLIMFRDLLIVQYDQRGNASVMAFAGKTGEQVWKTPRNVQVSWSSPVLAYTGKRTELILAADPAVISYNPSTGKELWRMDCISGEVGPSIAYADGIVFSVNEYSKLAAVEIGETPKLLWEDTEYMSDVPSPVATKDYLFLSTSYGTVVCYDAKTGTKHWVKEFGITIYSSPVLAEGKIYLLDKTGIMHIFRADKVFSSVAEP